MDTKHPFHVFSPACFGSAGSCTSTLGHMGSQGYAISWQQELGRKGEQQHQHQWGSLEKKASWIYISRAGTLEM